MPKALLKFVPAALGIFLLYSGIYKAIYHGEAIYGLRALEVPREPATAAIVLVTAMELYLGFILLVQRDLKVGLNLAMALMFAFTVYLWYLSTLANPPACGCMGLTGIFKSNRHNAIFGVFRNCAIIWLLKATYDSRFKSAPIQTAGPVTA